MSRPHFWMVWRCHGIPCVHFYFLFWTIIRKRYFDESDFHHCYGNFFESAIPNVVWSQLYSKFFLNSCEVHWPKHFESHPAAEDFTEMDQDTCWLLHQDLSKHYRTEINKGALKITTCKKIRPRTSKKIAPLIVTCFFFSQANLIFKFKPVFTDILDSFCHNLHSYLLITDILRSLNFIHCFDVFFVKDRKILMRFNILYLSMFQPQNVILLIKMFLLCSYFPWNILTC